MRQVGTLPHPQYKIVVYGAEHYFYVEIEAGPMKQCYKFKKDLVANLTELESLFTPEFKAEIYEGFNTMFKSYQKALAKQQP
jgi:hypothetical protein